MKDSFWFQHDSNAQHDERVLELRAEYGWEGYGLFWGLVEKMRDCPDYRLSMATVGGLSAGMGVLKPLLLGIIDLACKYGLLATEENGAYFYSPSLRRRMGQWDNKKASLSEAGRVGAERKKALKEAAKLREVEATLKPPLSQDANFPSREEKRREEENREEEPLSLRSEGAATAAASGQEKKTAPETLQPQSPPAAAPHTRDAADVATRKGKGKPPKALPGSLSPNDYELPEWAGIDFSQDLSEWLQRRQTRPDAKPLQAQAIQEYLTELAGYTPDFCQAIFRKSRQNPQWKGLTFDDTPAAFARQLQTNPRHAATSHFQQPERGAKPTGTGALGARAVAEHFARLDAAAGGADLRPVGHGLAAGAYPGQG